MTRSEQAPFDPATSEWEVEAEPEADELDANGSGEERPFDPSEADDLDEVFPLGESPSPTATETLQAERPLTEREWTGDAPFDPGLPKRGRPARTPGPSLPHPKVPRPRMPRPELSPLREWVVQVARGAGRGMRSVAVAVVLAVGRAGALVGAGIKRGGGALARGGRVAGPALRRAAARLARAVAAAATWLWRAIKTSVAWSAARVRTALGAVGTRARERRATQRSSRGAASPVALRGPDPGPSPAQEPAAKPRKQAPPAKPPTRPRRPTRSRPATRPEPTARAKPARPPRPRSRRRKTAGPAREPAIEPTPAAARRARQRATAQHRLRQRSGGASAPPAEPAATAAPGRPTTATSHPALLRPSAKLALYFAGAIAGAALLGSVVGLPLPLVGEGDQASSTAASGIPGVTVEGTPPSLAKGPLHPIAGAAPDYGEQAAKFHADRGGRKHEGQDVFAKKGTPLVAVREAIVVDRAGAKGRYAGGRGNYIAIYSAADGRSYVYFHMLRPTPFEIGDHVRAGEPVGQLGCTGSCFGPHLHFEVRNGKATLRGADKAKPVDPLPLLRQWPQLPSP